MLETLIVFSQKFKIGAWMIAGGADFRCLGRFDDTTAVATFPENCLRFFKDGGGLNGLD